MHGYKWPINSTRIVQAWTLDPARATCTLVAHSNNAYPSAFVNSGYPLRADPASFCKAKILGNAFAQQDSDMPAGVECAVLEPSTDDGGGAKTFPRSWRDANHR